MGLLPWGRADQRNGAAVTVQAPNSHGELRDMRSSHGKVDGFRPEGCRSHVSFDQAREQPGSASFVLPG